MASYSVSIHSANVDVFLGGREFRSEYLLEGINDEVSESSDSLSFRQSRVVFLKPFARPLPTSKNYGRPQKSFNLYGLYLLKITFKN